MKRFRLFENFQRQIRGWLPKEPILTAHQKAKSFVFFSNPIVKIVFVTIFFLVFSWFEWYGIGFNYLVLSLNLFWTKIFLFACYVATMLCFQVMVRKYWNERKRGGSTTTTAKSLKNRIRGWLPKEPVFPHPSNPKSSMPEVKAENQRGDKRTGRIIYVSILAGAILEGLFSAMGFGFYAAVPIGVAIPLVAIVADRRLKRPGKDLTGEQRKGVKTFAIANLAVGGLFALIILLTPIIKNGEVSLAFVIAMVASWFLVNRLLVRNYSKQASTKEAVI